jgi:heat shock protein HslJ
MRSLLMLLLFSLIFSACGEDTPVTEPAQLEGNWQLVRGLRNNMETETLKDLEFTFGEDGSFFTNLLGNAQTGTFELDGTTITTNNVKLPLTYTVRELTDSTLTLRTTYQNFQFDFELSR